MLTIIGDGRLHPLSFARTFDRRVSAALQGRRVKHACSGALHRSEKPRFLLFVRGSKYKAAAQRAAAGQACFRPMAHNDRDQREGRELGHRLMAELPPPPVKFVVRFVVTRSIKNNGSVRIDKRKFGISPRVIVTCH
jgi:hypothetical protein